MLIQPFHVGYVMEHLERGGLTLDMFHRDMGDALLTDKAGNGDTWYEWRQVMDYYTDNANVPIN